MKIESPKSTHSVFSTSGVPRVVVKNTSPGSIEVSQNPQNEVVVDFDIKEAEYIDWNSSQTGDLIVVNCRIKSGEFWPAIASLRGPRANISIRVPKNANLDLAGRYGGVTVGGISGTSTVETTTGNISFRDCEGSATSETKTGLVNFVNYNGKVSGRNMAGSIAFTGTITGESSFMTKAGNIELTLIGKEDLAIDASSKVGRVNIDPSIKIENLQSDLYMVGHNLRCTLGDGTHRLHLETYTGVITIRRP